jgi:hypothetical protein
MIFLSGLIIGVIVGVILGGIAMALLAVSGQSDQCSKCMTRNSIARCGNAESKRGTL